MNYDIPVYRSSLSGNEKRYVMDCLDSTWISGKGPYVERFEEGVAEFIGARYAVAVSNGTVALHLALMALGIGPGDEVIVPTFTYIAPVNTIAQCGAQPVFVDSLSSSWQMDPADIAAKITPRTRAIIVVHLYGHPCDMEAIVRIAREHDLFVIEDCAEAFGSLYQGRHVGLFGDIGTFSFYGNKTITTGEGGMCVTNEHALKNRLFKLKGQGLAQYREYWHDTLGFNYRMTNICAAIGLAQLEQADEFIQRKLEVAEHYKSQLADSPITVQPTVGDVRHSYWMVSVLLPDLEMRERVRDALRDKSIETRPTFYPVHTMPMYASRYERHRVAEDVAMRGINLPSFPMLTADEITLVSETLKRAVDRAARPKPRARPAHGKKRLPAVMSLSERGGLAPAITGIDDQG